MQLDLRSNNEMYESVTILLHNTPSLCIFPCGLPRLPHLQSHNLTTREPLLKDILGLPAPTPVAQVYPLVSWRSHKEHPRAPHHHLTAPIEPPRSCPSLANPPHDLICGGLYLSQSASRTCRHTFASADLLAFTPQPPTHTHKTALQESTYERRSTASQAAPSNGCSGCDSPRRERQSAA